jgi:hypothetical protein
MTKTHPDETRKRLAEHYASITEEELRQFADDAWSLTDSAKELLKASFPGLAIKLRDPPTKDEPVGELVILRTFRDLPEALLAKSILDSSGIKCFLQDENAIRLNWLWSNALGSMKLLVREEDASEAAQLLEQKRIESFDLTAGGSYKQPRCPVCDERLSPRVPVERRLALPRQTEQGSPAA